MRVPLVDLHHLYQSHRAEVDAAIARVLASQHFILGLEVEDFESELAAYLGHGRHCVGTSSGSSALVMTLMALLADESARPPGVLGGPIGAEESSDAAQARDEVIVPAYSFVATASAVSRAGARPVFVDVLPDSLNIDPAAVADRLSSRTRAVIAVHLFGRPAPISALREVLIAAGRGEVPIVEDAAQALGAQTASGPVGTLADWAALSFFPAKNLGAFGDAGAVAAADPDGVERVRILSRQGADRPHHHVKIGLNARLDALQAAVLRSRLPHLDEWVAERRRNADRYRALFADVALGDELRLPPGDSSDGRQHSYNQFNLRVDPAHRDHLRHFLAQAGITTAVYYPRPLPTQPCFAGLGHRSGDFPVAERAARESLAVPIAPGLKEVQQRWVVDRIDAYFRHHA